MNFFYNKNFNIKQFIKIKIKLIIKFIIIKMFLKNNNCMKNTNKI